MRALLLIEGHCPGGATKVRGTREGVADRRARTNAWALLLRASPMLVRAYVRMGLCLFYFAIQPYLFVPRLTLEKLKVV